MIYEELTTYLRAKGLARVVDPLLDQALPSIYLTRRPVDEALLAVGASKIGGTPDLPPDTPWPHWQGEPLVGSAFTPDVAEELRGYVERLLTEMYALPVNWQMHSLLPGTYAVEAELRVRHPELSDDAIHALGWDFSYSRK